MKTLKNKVLLFLIFGMGLCFNLQALAQEIEPERFGQSQERLKVKDHSFDSDSHVVLLGTVLQSFDFKESFPEKSNLKGEERGFVPGFVFGYKHFSGQSPLVFDFRGSYSGSSVLYEGSLKNGLPSKDRSGLSLFNLRATVGLFLLRSSSDKVNFNAGLGYRLWNREIEKEKGKAKVATRETNRGKEVQNKHISNNH